MGETQITQYMSFDPQIKEFVAKDFYRYPFYSNFIREFDHDKPNAEGRFRLEKVVPGACFGVFGGGSDKIGAITVIPLQPGEVRDVGKLVLHERKDE